MKENAKLQVNSLLSVKTVFLSLICIAERGEVQDLLHEGVYGENRQGT